MSKTVLDIEHAGEEAIHWWSSGRSPLLMSVEEDPKIEGGEGAGRSPTSVLARESAAVQIMEPLPHALSPRCTVTRVQEYTPAVRGQLRELLSEFHDLLVTLGVPSDANHSVDKEIAELHSKFAMVLVATRAVPEAACGAAGGIEVFGCIALMDLGDGVCEMKRLFVRPCGRRTGAGGALCEALLEAAASDGYSLMKLGTLERLSGACDLYERLGFTACGPYRVHRLTEPDTRYYERATVHDDIYH